MIMFSAALERIYSTKLSDERLAEIVEGLSEPFDPEVVKFRVGPTRKENGVKMGMALAYANTRAYWDRLNAVVGHGNWFNFAETTIGPKMERTKTKLDWSTRPPTEEEIIIDSAKLIVTVSVGVVGMSFRTEVGEEWADSEMAETSAYAMAFKRAWASIGLGRYLYDLEGGYFPVYGQSFSDPGPQLPAWALPPMKCLDGCGSTIKESRTASGVVYTPDMIVSETRKRFNQDLCWKCWRAADAALRTAAAGAKSVPAIAAVQAIASGVPGVIAGTAGLPKANKPNGQAS